MKVFVTGADGFIGSHLCEALRDDGYDVTGLALYNSFDNFGWLDEVEGVEKVRGDVRDAEQMRALIKGHDIVFHLAALISVPYSYEATQSFIDTNVTGTLNVLMAARETDAKVIHTSTSEVYGTAQYVPQDEKHPINPQSPYAASKVAADALVTSFHHTYGLPAVILRPFNTYGPRQSERAVLATMIRQSLDANRHQIVLGNLDSERDFIYVDDTVRAFMAAANVGFGVYNVGTGIAYSIRAAATVVVGQVSPPKAVISIKSRFRPPTSEVVVLRCDAREFMRHTEWKPQVSFHQGIKRTVFWWRNRRHYPGLENVA